MKLHPAQDPDSSYKTVSKERLGYLSAEAEELVRLHRKTEALRIYKSVRYLASLDPSIGITGGEATSKIRAMANREKDRFTQYDLETAVLLVRMGSMSKAHNESAGYTVSADGSIVVLTRRVSGSTGYMLDAAAFGISVGDQAQNGYDAIVTVTAETFRNEFDSVDKYETVYRNKTPSDNFVREKIVSSENAVLYRFSGGSPSVYQGYEKLAASGTRGFVVRVMAPSRAGADALTKKIMDGCSVSVE
jgi:hypothetical protein